MVAKTTDSDGKTDDVRNIVDDKLMLFCTAIDSIISTTVYELASAAGGRTASSAASTGTFSSMDQRASLWVPFVIRDRITCPYSLMGSTSYEKY